MSCTYNPNNRTLMCENIDITTTPRISNEKTIEHMTKAANISPKCYPSELLKNMDYHISICNRNGEYNVPGCKNPGGGTLRCPKIGGTPAGTFGYYCKSGRTIIPGKNWFCPPDNSRWDPTVTWVQGAQDQQAANNLGLSMPAPAKPPNINAIYSNASDNSNINSSDHAKNSANNAIANLKTTLDPNNFYKVNTSFSWGV
jgi:hypothetical protein